MQIIDKKALDIMEQYNSGYFSKVYKVAISEQLFSYKNFTKLYPIDIMQNIIDMTDEEFSTEFLTPLYMTEVFHNYYDGYITHILENAKKLNDVYLRNKMILLLKKAKLAILKLHQEHQRIHGDLSVGNILTDEDEDKIYLVDFDSSLRINQEVGNLISFSCDVQYYLKHYPLDYKVDAYNFNLTTLSLLTKKKVFEVLDGIEEDNLFFSENNKMVRKLSRELLLKDTRKKYSGEYIIDYIK